MTFLALHLRLVAEVQARIRNGNLSERGMARRLGVSQSHIHNVLKGARALSPAMSDRILEGLGISLVNLLEELPPPGPPPVSGPKQPLRGKSPAPVRRSSAS